MGLKWHIYKCLGIHPMSLFCLKSAMQLIALQLDFQEPNPVIQVYVYQAIPVHIHTVYYMQI